MSPRRTSPGETAKIATEARNLPCENCGALPGRPCVRPGRGRSVCKARFIAAAITVTRQAKAQTLTAEQAAALARLRRVPRAEIEACRTEKGGYAFTREKLRAWGVPWPPPPGWRRVLEYGPNDSSRGDAPR